MISVVLMKSEATFITSSVTALDVREPGSEPHAPCRKSDTKSSPQVYD